MIVLHDVIEAINNSPIYEGWLVGGVVERGWSNRDVDLVVANPKVAEGLPSYFDVIIQEGKPEGVLESEGRGHSGKEFYQIYRRIIQGTGNTSAQ